MNEEVEEHINAENYQLQYTQKEEGNEDFPCARSEQAKEKKWERYKSIIWNLVFDIWYLEFGIWSLEFRT